MAGIQLLPLHKLGWDTTMRIIARNATDFSKPFESLEYSCQALDLEDYYWVIEMPSPRPDDDTKMDPDKKEIFILIQPISMSRGDDICGRATRVWKARKMSDMTKFEAQQLVRSSTTSPATVNRRLNVK